MREVRKFLEVVDMVIILIVMMVTIMEDTSAQTS